MSEQPRYPSDLSDAEWAILEPLVDPPRQERRGRPRTVERREVVNAVWYLLRTGCQWRYLPTDLPRWQTAAWYFSRWVADGTWERVNDTLRRQVRVAAGRHPEPSAASIDSQSARTAEKGGIVAMTPAKR